jgi:flagellar biosynthesis protein FlhA
MKGQLTIPIAIVIILMAVIVPLPTFVVDILISANIALSVIILLSSVHLLNPVKFSSFPSILLISTLFRLSLNIASTRLILLNGKSGPGAAAKSSRHLGSSWWAVTTRSALSFSWFSSSFNTS